jgi:hypothetical protein
MTVVAQEWKRCRHWIEAALERAPTHTIEDIEIGLVRGIYVFWPASRSAAITEIHIYPRAKHMHLFLAGGDLDELKSMVPMWRSWARFNGCSKLTLAGRRGWERALKDQGWKADLVFLSIPAGEEP